MNSPEPTYAVEPHSFGALEDEAHAFLRTHGSAVEPAAPLATLLTSHEARAAVASRALAAGPLAPDNAMALTAVLEPLWISAESYRLHRARDVYDTACVHCWDPLRRPCWGAQCKRRQSTWSSR
jgi:hypothetical protein